MVKEEINEDDEIQPISSLQGRRRQARFKLIQDGNEFGGRNKRNRSTELTKGRVERKLTSLGIQHHRHDFGNVSEEDDEHASDSSGQSKHRKNKQKNNSTYSIGYLTK